jgi:hypothetical protein
MKKEIKVEMRKSAFVNLEDYCIHSVGERKGKGDFLEVTEWSNGEGYDVHIEDSSGPTRFMLTWGQFEAMKKCIKVIDKTYNHGKY